MSTRTLTRKKTVLIPVGPTGKGSALTESFANLGNTVRDESSAWSSLSYSRQLLVKAMLSIAFVQLLITDIYFRVQELPQIYQYLSGASGITFIEDGIGYPPFVVSALACGVLLAASVAIVNLKAGRDAFGSSWLGSAWILASGLLVIDLAIDTFEVKWPIIALFVVVGFRSWKGPGRTSLGLILAPAVAAIAFLDGQNHLGGQDCASTGLATCQAKAISDVYLVLGLLVLTYVTAMAWRRTAAAQSTS